MELSVFFLMKFCLRSLSSGIIGLILANDGSSIFLDAAYTSNLFKKEMQWLRICDIGYKVENLNPSTARGPLFEPGEGHLGKHTWF